MEEQHVETSKFKFLADNPVAEDQFGPHQQIADAIAEKVESDPTGMTIGIEGTWGSGKSSVIRMIEKRWENHKEIKVFTFDAWTHDGDSLRRSFLETLITSLQCSDSEPWLSKDISKDNSEDPLKPACPSGIRQALRRRSEESTVKSEPTITKWGIWFAAATLLMPIGVALISASSGSLDWRLWIGLLMAAVPLLLILIFIIIMNNKGVKGYLAEIVGKTKETTRHTTHRGIEPTSIEFGEYYAQILEATFGGDGHANRRLVIVLDNLDRISEEAALRAWATMRTFLQPGNDRQDDLRKKVWLIVPYDPGAIQNLWSQGNAAKNDKPNNSSGEGNADEANAHKKSRSDNELARAFKEKTFQIRYRVAPPLASRWQDYFDDCLKKAFPDVSDVSDECRDAIYHMFRIQALPTYQRGMPTPREMKLFVNRVVALAQQHHPKVPLPEIALYAALEMSDTSLLDNLAEGEFQNLKLLGSFLQYDHWRQNLAAIHFGVPIENAAEVLYVPRIRQILKEGNATAMRELLADPAARQCCESHLLDTAPAMALAEIVAASKAFAEFKPGSAPPRLKTSILALVRRLMDVDDHDWQPGGGLDEDAAQAVIHLLEFAPSSVTTVVKRLSFSLPEVAKTVDLNAALPTWAAGTALLLNYAKQHSSHFQGIFVELPLSEDYQLLMDSLAKLPNAENVISLVQPAENVKEDYISELLGQAETGVFRKEDAVIMSGLMRMPCLPVDDSAMRIAEAVKDRLFNKPGSDDFCRAVRFLLSKLSDAENDPFSAVLASYAESSNLAAIFKQPEPETIALCSALYMLYNPVPDPAGTASQQYNNFLGGGSKKAYPELAELCIKYGLLEQLLDSIKKNDLGEKAFFKPFLSAIVEKDNSAQALNSDLFIKHSALIEKTLYEKTENEAPNIYETLVKRLLHMEKNSLLPALESLSNDDFLTLMRPCMRPCFIAINDQELDTASLENKLRARFNQVTREQWLKQLYDKSPTLDVLLLLCKTTGGVELGYQYANALIDHAVQLRDGQATVEDESLRNAWPTIINCISNQERDAFHTKLINKVIEDGSKSLENVIPLYGERLCEALSQGYKDESRRQNMEDKLALLAENENNVQRNWLIGLLANDVDMKSMSEQCLTCLQDRLQNYIKSILATEEGETENRDDDSIQLQKNAAKLADQFGIVLPPADKATDDAAEEIDETVGKK